MERVLWTHFLTLPRKGGRDEDGGSAIDWIHLKNNSSPSLREGEERCKGEGHSFDPRFFIPSPSRGEGIGAGSQVADERDVDQSRDDEHRQRQQQILLETHSLDSRSVENWRRLSESGAPAEMPPAYRFYADQAWHPGRYGPGWSFDLKRPLLARGRRASSCRSRP